MPFNEHQTIQHQMFRIRFTELNEIFAVMSLRSFVSSMISIFVPIYMYSLGYPLADIFLFHIYIFAAEFIFEYIATNLVSKFGPKHAMALSLPFFITHLWMLSTLQAYGWPLWLPGVIGGISLAFYWQGYHYDFSRSRKKSQTTKDISRLYILLAILGAIAPFIGGFIATHYGFGMLYGVVIILLSLVFIPLIKGGEKHSAKKLHFKKINLRGISRDLLSYGGTGMEGSVALTIWPLFIFFIVGTYEKVGLVTSLALILTIAVTYVVGKRANSGNRYKFIRAGSFLDMFIYLIVIFIDSFVQVLSLNFARSLVSSLRAAPFISEYYLHADETSRSEYIYFMESTIDLFRLAMFSALYLATFVFAGRAVLIIGLLFGAVGSLFAGFMPPAKCEMPFCKNDKIRLIPKLRAQHETDR